ncbi:MAG: hypothetical protein LBT50_11560 [Prevotellaceae bacterium]|jgi:hypothetical protein|nr:hypothetical protein [Prevotellaceae bacterium]
MIDFDNNMDDFPKLTPDESIRFELKDEIKRSPEMDFECNESEYSCLTAAEEGREATNRNLVEQYKKIRLTPDMNLMFPDKKSLKHRTFNLRLLWIPAAAALIVFAMIIRQNVSENPPVAEINSEEISNPAPNPVADIIPEPEIVPETKIKETVPAKKVRKTAKKIVAVAVENKPAENDLSTGTVENNDDIPRPEIAKLERITAASATVEMLNQEKTVFVLQQYFLQNPVQEVEYNNPVTIAEKLGIANAIKGFTAEINKDIAPIIENFKLKKFLTRSNIEFEIGEQIEDWVKNHQDVPVEIHVGYSSENKMAEIYDDNGTLVKAIFFTNKSLKYKNREINSNN